MIMAVNILIYRTERSISSGLWVNSRTKYGDSVWVTSVIPTQNARHSPTIDFIACRIRSALAAP